MNTDLAPAQGSYRRLLLIAAAIMLALGGAYGCIRLRYMVQGVALPLVAIDNLPHYATWDQAGHLSLASESSAILDHRYQRAADLYAAG